MQLYKFQMSDLSDASEEETSEVQEVPSSKQKAFPVNNVFGMQQKLQDIALNLEWMETLDIITNTPEAEEESESAVDTKAENDFKREMSFYNQAMEGVSRAFKHLKKSGIVTKRPEDYYAEMAKSDAHMQKVREKLLSKQSAVERREKVRALREQKKQGKKIQTEIIQQRKQEKKKMISALKKTKKGKMSADHLLNERGQATQKSGPTTQKKKGKKSREFRDSKFGYGGKKKGAKYNTAESSAMSGGGKKKNFGASKPQFGKKRMSKHTRRR